MRESSSAGFRKIAKFIFGGNSPAGAAGASSKGENIAMTSPVRMEIQGTDSSSSGSSKIAMT